jgi:hypothetical protein
MGEQFFSDPRKRVGILILFAMVRITSEFVLVLVTPASFLYG